MATTDTNQEMTLEKGYLPQEPPPGYYQPGSQGGFGQQHLSQVPPYTPQFNQNFSSTTQVVNSQPQSVPATVIVQGAFAPRPSNYMCLSCCILWCCNPLFGIIAFIFSILSSTAYDEGRYEQARSHGKTALILNLVGVVISIILITVFVALAVTAVHNQQ